jgi:hypothetical protein
MQPLGATLGPDGAEALIDKGRAVMAVEILRVVRADEVDGLVVPARVVEQLFPDRAGLVELLHSQAFLQA